MQIKKYSTSFIERKRMLKYMNQKRILVELTGTSLFELMIFGRN